MRRANHVSFSSAAPTSATYNAGSELENIRRRLISGSKKLEESAVIEMAVGSQIDKTNDTIRQLNETIRNNEKTIREYEERCDWEERKAEEVQEKEKEENKEKQQKTHDEEIAKIKELEETLRGLYKEKARLRTMLAERNNIKGNL